MKRVLPLLAAVAVGLGAPDGAAAERRQVTLRAGGDSISLTVVLPDAYQDGGAHPVVLALPPGAGTRAMVDSILAAYWIEEGNRRGYVLVSPAVPGPDLESSGRGVLDSLFAWMDENLSYDPARVTLAGQSNGGLGAFYLARMAPERFSSIVVMPGGYGGRGDLDSMSGKPVLLLVGERDTGWVQLSEHTRDLLSLANARPRLQIIPGAGHVFPYPQTALYDWIEQYHPE